MLNTREKEDEKTFLIAFKEIYGDYPATNNGYQTFLIDKRSEFRALSKAFGISSVFLFRSNFFIKKYSSKLFDFKDNFRIKLKRNYRNVFYRKMDFLITLDTHSYYKSDVAIFIGYNKCDFEFFYDKNCKSPIPDCLIDFVDDIEFIDSEILELYQLFLNYNPSSVVLFFDTKMEKFLMFSYSDTNLFKKNSLENLTSIQEVKLDTPIRLKNIDIGFENILFDIQKPIKPRLNL
ncbi:hypothetical protein CWI38_0420p0010 [Hamiltosporidium tvaerminnensis]|uniref:Uncharacterized protein n=1 Tax=Hamiltosporidium tvaerminnensis TaxID=1176355 RepID=A0A4Q9LXN8_9MICR|nr:hypothetical protein CWI38_0420p0010 [Hamiltosporidium tvaerminnensis]